MSLVSNAQSTAHVTTYPGPQTGLITFVEIDHEIISTVILPFLLIQEGQLSVTGKVYALIIG